MLGNYTILKYEYINYFYYLKNCGSQNNTVDHIIGSIENIWVVEITQLCRDNTEISIILLKILIIIYRI